MGKFGSEYMIDDYIIASIMIYIDIIQIFMYLLELFGRNR
jgi:FtsH-binding integral membrane protein